MSSVLRARKYSEALPDIIRSCGKYMMENAEAIGSTMLQAKSFRIEFQLDPATDNVFEPCMKIERTTFLMDAFKTFYSGAEVM